MKKQHRHFVRVPFDATTTATQGDRSWEVQLLDISLNGVLFSQPEDWLINPSQLIKIKIVLGEGIHIKMDTRLVHTTENTAGCHCEHIDVDSITQLKRLIELNTGSDDILSRELSALIEEHSSGQAS